MTILVVDDEEDILELMKVNLLREGYKVICAADGEEALKLAKAQLPSLVILDLMLPGIDGLEVCRTLRSDPKTEHIPVIMLSAKGSESDIIVGLEVGADDYVTKPFSPKVLIARVKRVLRKKVESSLARKTVSIHDVTIDPARHEVAIKDKRILLTLTEFNILYAMARRPGMVFTRYQIVDAVHGDNYLVTDRAIDVQIAYLRRKLGPARKYIETVRGVGYRFRD
jgi:two-component system phosphate regulon response regulator PhoB